MLQSVKFAPDHPNGDWVRYDMGKRNSALSHRSPVMNATNVFLVSSFASIACLAALVTPAAPIAALMLIATTTTGVVSGSRI